MRNSKSQVAGRWEMIGPAMPGMAHHDETPVHLFSLEKFYRDFLFHPAFLVFLAVGLKKKNLLVIFGVLRVPP